MEKPYLQWLSNSMHHLCFDKPHMQQGGNWKFIYKGLDEQYMALVLSIKYDAAEKRIFGMLC